MVDMNKVADNQDTPINFHIRGAWGVNKLQTDMIFQRGFDSTRFIITLAFIVDLLSNRKTESDETSHHLKTVSAMVTEFACETQEVLGVIKDDYKEQIKKRDKYRDELYKLRKSGGKK